MLTGFDTHEVTNQPPPLEGHDVFTPDVAFVDAVARSGAAWAVAVVRRCASTPGKSRTGSSRPAAE